jgi:hypothetical protein
MQAVYKKGTVPESCVIIHSEPFLILPQGYRELFRALCQCFLGISTSLSVLKRLYCFTAVKVGQGKYFVVGSDLGGGLPQAFAVVIGLPA